MKLKRRGFLHTLAAGGLLALLRGRTIDATPASSGPQPAPAWLSCLPATPGGRHLGATCLQQHLVESSPGALKAALETTLGKPPGTRRAARRRLATVVGNEFAQRDWVRVEGWWLSRTEARLYALASLKD